MTAFPRFRPELQSELNLKKPIDPVVAPLARKTVSQLLHLSKLNVYTTLSANPREDLGVTALARHVNMSPRNFNRLFRQEVGVTPAKYVAHSRLLRAFFLLEQTLMPIDAIAKQSGFRVFRNHAPLLPAPP